MDQSFSWPKPPSNHAEFQELMNAIDKYWESVGVSPYHRPSGLYALLSDTFGWGAHEFYRFPPPELAALDGFDGRVLVAKALKWNDEVYGDKLKRRWPLSRAAYAFRCALYDVY